MVNLGVLLQTTATYCLFVRRRNARRLRSLLWFSGDHIYKGHNAPPKYAAVCDESVNRMYKNAIEDISIIVIGSSMAIGAIPLYTQLVLHERMLYYPHFLPFTNLETTTGYWVNLMHQLMMAPFAYATVFGAELILQMIKNTTWAQAVVVSHDLSELNELLNEGPIDEFQLKSRLRNILAKISDYNRYLSDFIDLFYWRWFSQSTLIMFSIGLTLFLFIMESIQCLRWLFLQRILNKIPKFVVGKLSRDFS